MIKWPGFSSDNYLICQEPDPDRKDDQYYKTNMFAFYSEWIKGTSMIGYGGMDRIDMLRAYAEGKQPDPPQVASTRPGSILDINGNPLPISDDAEVPGYNVQHEVWEIFSSANQIMDSLEGALSKVDFEISCDPLDPTTKHEIEDNKLRAWAYAKNKKKIQFAAQLAGVEVPEPDFIPEEPQDLEQNDEKFLPDHAMYVEQVVKHSFDISHWKPDTIKLLYRDWFACGTACVQDQYNPETGKVEPVYIDIRHADVQPSKYPDHRDSERGWHFELMNLTKIRQFFPDKDEDFFHKIAGSYCGQFGNPAPNNFSMYVKQDPYGQWLYNSFKVCVMSAEWLDIEKRKEVIGTKHGRKQVKEVPLNKNVTHDKTVRFSEDRRRYEAKWIVGTEEIFEYGPAHENSPYLTYHWYTLPGKSKIEVLVPVLKQLQDLWDRYREVLRNARGKGLVIDIDKLASTGGTDDPGTAAKKAYRRFLATYTMFIRRVNAAGMPDQSQPMSDSEGGMGVMFQELMLAFQLNFDMQEKLSGLNPLSMGQAPDPNAPVTTSQMAMNATTSSLKPLVDGYARTKQGVSENEARWIVMLVRGNEFSRKAYEEVVGAYGVQSLIAASKSEAAYGFRLTARPTDLEKQWLLQNLQAAVTPAQGGEREISTADANTLLNMIASETPMKSIQFAFEKARRKQEAALMAKKQQLMKQQSELNQQDSAASAQAQSQLADKLHGQKMDQISKTNEGLVGNSVAQETLRKQKDESVQELKNQGVIQHEMVKPVKETAA